MLNNFKASIMSAITPYTPPAQNYLQDKFRYSRPLFLELLTRDELRASSDHSIRPIIVPRNISILPWDTGYAECINSGKSKWNEDQAAFSRQVLSDPDHIHPDLPYTYFGIFDGHAGYGAALAASYQLSHILHEKLVDCIELLLPRDTHNGDETAEVNPAFPHPAYFHRKVSKDELIIGALEAAFFDMDELLRQDNPRYRNAGGCTACVVLFIDGKMYVANAGDSRAVLCQRRSSPKATPTTAITPTTTAPTTTAASESNEGVIEADSSEDDTLSYSTPFSFDHTPETERERLENMALLQPDLIEDAYVAMEYAKRPQIKDMGQRILCRKGNMKGWTYKTVTSRDLAHPVVYGEGKRSRLLGTLGVTRGFGDHQLVAINTRTPIKPFLTPHPEVRQRDLSQVVSIPDEHNEDGDYGMLVMATDGLWDVSENEAVARTVFQILSRYPTERHRYTMAAQELVARARGKANFSGHWRLSESKGAATVDDISVIVIPVYQYYKEHVEWTQTYTQQKRDQPAKRAGTNVAQEAVNVLNGIIAEEANVVEEHPQQQQVEVQVEQRPSQKQKTQDDFKYNSVKTEKKETPLEARLETVNEALQQVQLDASESQTGTSTKTTKKTDTDTTAKTTT
ncbi:protein phosphatase 1H isoform X2 [Drosophila innubila]|uniref:protein phosphatase 1H isoform X2 n=1 Tax=Drosophila innubila TaxID=198719 RepID=UPI00148DF9F0|nr:protein phosphatase 1H isoform X2 [Drosophila innubila]